MPEQCALKHPCYAFTRLSSSSDAFLIGVRIHRLFMLARPARGSCIFRRTVHPMGSAMRILLVEDERSAARMIAKGLREHGNAVDMAGDGAAAVDQAAAVTYDVVILDLMLPMKSGLDVCRELRSKGDSVPVLMLTARDAVDDRIAGFDAGADDYLTKPFHFRELLARVRAMARRRALPLAARAP